MYILGIDPGTGRTGWGVIQLIEPEQVLYVAHGCITTDKDHLMQNRLLQLHESLSGIIEQYKPEQVAVEQIFFGMNAKTAISVSQARGVILMTAAKHNVSFYEYTSISVKHFLSGSGRAEKKQMQEVVRNLLSKDSTSLPFSAKDKAFDDAADALAIAIHHTWKYVGKILDIPDLPKVEKIKKRKTVVKKKLKK